jgi:hypothetical protein
LCVHENESDNSKTEPEVWAREPFACSKVHWPRKPGCKRNKRVKSKDSRKRDISKCSQWLVRGWIYHKVMIVYAASSLTVKCEVQIYMYHDPRVRLMLTVWQTLWFWFCSVSLQWCAGLVPLSSSKTLLHQRKSIYSTQEGT